MAAARVEVAPRGEIRAGGLDRPEVAALMREHLLDMHRHTPPGSIHALDLDALRAPGISFWCMWAGDELMGCGALKELDPGHGEIKSMRTARGFMRQGVARRMLGHILAEARRRRYRRLSLETGSTAAFGPAQRLYLESGFRRCGPFADYTDDPNSIYMTLELEAPPAAQEPGAPAARV
jgi:putative acetyltransferase